MRRIVFVAACLLVPSLAFAELTEEAVAAKMDALREWMSAQVQRPAQEAVVAKLHELTADIDVASLNMEEINRAAFFLVEDDALLSALRGRLEILAGGADGPGAEAAIMRMLLSLRERSDDLGAQLNAALSHPGLGAALKAGKGYEMLGVLEHVPAELLAAQGERITGLIAYVPDTLDPETLLALSSYVTALGNLGEVVPLEQRRAAQQKVVGLYTTGRDRARAAGDDDAAQMLDSRLGYLEGAAARGELLNHPAPQLDLEWISSGEEIKDLSALRGKVVVVDFWATWCGPCIASFPNLRALREKYSPEQVAMLGVTSLQGRHFARGKPPVDTQDQPELEHSLMKEFIQQMEITWTVAFSRQDVFNRDFNVQGIPHLAIIAADGTVRYNGLSPHGDLNDKTGKIDGLLAEMIQLP